MSNFNHIAAFIIDMDGVLWHGDRPVDGLEEFFSVLRSRQLPFILATNNASLTQQQYQQKLAAMGIDVRCDEILTSSMATARHLDKIQPQHKRRVFMIGEQGLAQPLQEHGFTLTGLFQVDQPHKGIVGERADIVVTGLDRKLTWEKLATATLNIRQGAAFYATNADTTLPTELGEVIGNGGTIAALTAATGVKPVCIGKPEAELYRQALDRLGTTAEQTVAIGDRLDTDILGAVNAGMCSILVLSGVSSQQDIQQVHYQPTWVMDDIRAISHAINTMENP